MKSKITVIGAGSVGATIAYTLSNEDIATEIVLIDINKQKAEGEVMDIIQGTCFRDPISIKSGDYEDAKDSNIVIITSGVARKPGQSRLELTQTNVDIIKSIAPNIAKAAPNALYIIVSNPVDIITYVFMKISGIPENQIIGSGTARWIPRVCVSDLPATLTLRRRTFMPMFSVSTGILPLSRGRAQRFPVRNWTTMWS